MAQHGRSMSRRGTHHLPNSMSRNPNNRVPGHGPMKTKWSRGTGTPQRSKSNKRRSRV